MIKNSEALNRARNNCCGMSVESHNCEASRNSSANMLVAGQWLSKHHATTAMLMYATTEKLLEVVFSMKSVQRLIYQGLDAIMSQPEKGLGCWLGGHQEITTVWSSWLASAVLELYGCKE
jgi:hypothetical protein